MKIFHLQYWLLWPLLTLLICPLHLYSQKKRQLSKDDYHLWGKLYIEKPSADGKWTSYRMHYDEHPDTLYVQSLQRKIVYKFPNAYASGFGSNSIFTFYNENGSFNLLNLKTGDVSSLDGVESFEFLNSGQFIITLEVHDGLRKLILRNAEGSIVKIIDNVSLYRSNDTTASLAISYLDKNCLDILKYESWDYIDKICTGRTLTVTKIEWAESGLAIAFISSVADSTKTSFSNEVHYHNFATNKTSSFTNDRLSEEVFESPIADGDISRLTISPDGKRVFFGVNGSSQSAFSTDSIQIWNGNDKWTYPERKMYSIWQAVPYIVCWTPSTDKVISINKDRPHIFFNGDMRYAVSYNEIDVGPQYSLSIDTNYYITDLETGGTEMWLPEYAPANYDFSISPSGKFIAYYRDCNYWVYNFDDKVHSNITKNISAQWEDPDVFGVPTIYGIGGWANHDESILLHDAYDLYQLDVHDGRHFKLTDGRESGCVYRLLDVQPIISSMNFTLRTEKTVDFSSGLPLSCNCSITNSIGLLQKNGNVKIFDTGAMEISAIYKAKNANTYIYTTQRYDRPPDLRVANDNKVRAIFQSNNHHKKYVWGKSEPILFTNNNGNKLKGVLTYPANYVAGKKYPLVVVIYDQQYQYLHRYENPSYYNMMGINVTNLTSQGYFVLRPDFYFENSDPGISATDCTVAAVDEVLKLGVIDPERIGLYGASFGGYETNFILTQTNTFAAAISGCGISDLQSHYLSIGWNNSRPEIWRYENHIWRMSKSLFDDRESYRRNSPIEHVANVTTPVLLWAGEQDKQVNYSQTLEFYLALRRLGKKQILLIYPEEGHVLLKSKFQKDLTNRIDDWYAHYLNGRPKQWVADGTK